MYREKNNKTINNLKDYSGVGIRVQNGVSAQI